MSFLALGVLGGVAAYPVLNEMADTLETVYTFRYCQYFNKVYKQTNNKNKIRMLEHKLNELYQEKSKSVPKLNENYNKYIMIIHQLDKNLIDVRDEIRKLRNENRKLEKAFNEYR